MSQNIVENFKSMYYGFNLRFMLPLYLDNDTTYIFQIESDSVCAIHLLIKLYIFEWWYNNEMKLVVLLIT